MYINQHERAPEMYLGLNEASGWRVSQSSQSSTDIHKHENVTDNYSHDIGM